MIDDICSKEKIIAFDPSYIPKAGQSTFGTGYFWSGCAKAAKWGLDICGFAVIDVTNNTAFHLKAFQTPDIDYFSLDYNTDEIKIYSAVVYSNAFKRNIKLAITIFYKDNKEIARKLYFSTDLMQSGENIVKCYRSRYQIEFLYRDAKQNTGLTNCQARSEHKLDFHFNSSLTAVNIAKHDWLRNKQNERNPFSMANYKTLYNNMLLIEKFISMFGINPNLIKNQKIINELLDYGKIAA